MLLIVRMIEFVDDIMVVFMVLRVIIDIVVGYKYWRIMGRIDF